ncbi:hypothetical protein KZ829_00940 [Actinoplanes hulinensis]|uniref:Uncharacterized protein n=1 Tax=Actinoplanes hulinensis TaxID=1144547 RepID=A0ABS7AU41_9ACTN|nr:hypothetical protein [Actinoplanes hulinensis]MBW6432311.1 hypothetical protein [Actinoplanes hulinensis]
MRVFRTILGMLLLTIGLPALLAGGGLWAVMQHRDPGGAFTGELQRLTVPGYAVVVPDIDRLLRDDVPFARMTGTRMRLSAATADGPAFLGIAPSDAVARYLAGVPYNRVDGVDLGTGILPVTAVRSGGRRTPDGVPARQTFWTASGAGLLAFTPAELGDRPHSLVLMNPGGTPVTRLATVAEVRPGWLNSGTWGLLTLGTLLVMAGVIVLTWPGRRREVVYVVEPSQVPELMHAIGAPLPLPGGRAYHAGARGGAHRPRTLADSRPSRPPALPQFAWPPKRPAGPFPPAFTATLDGPEPASGPVSGPLLPDGAASVDALPGPDSPGGSGASAPGDRAPAPGQPLSLLGDTPILAGSQPGTVPARRGDRRHSPSSPDAPGFQATAVGAWVAATAPERARQTEARAAARLAEASRRNAGKFTPAPTGKTNMPGATIPIAPRRGRTTANPEGPPTTDPTESVAEESAPLTAAAEPATQTTAVEEPAGRTSDAGDGQTENHADDADRATTPPKTPAQRPESAAPQTPGQDEPTAKRTATNPDPVRPDDGPTTADGPARVVLRTGPAATDWTATGLTRLVLSRPAPTGSPTGDRGEAAPADGEQRPSIHAVEAGIPVLDEVAAPETVESGVAPTPSVADSAQVEAPDPAPVTTDPAQVEAGRSEPEQPPTRPGRSKRASMHAVEAGGLTLSRKPAPVPTQGLATPSRPASGSPAPETVAEPAPEHAATAETPNGEPAPEHAAKAETPNDGPAERNASSEPVKTTAKAGGGAKAGPTEGVKTPKAKAGRSRTTEPGDDNPMARAQSRLSGGNPTPPRQAPATRRTPASWVRAAESVAARTGVQEPDGTAQPVPPKTRTAGTRTAGDPKPEPKPELKPEPKPEAKPKPELKPEAKPEPKAAGGQPLSYREEAAKLLAGSSEQRRRRSPAVRNRPKDGDEKS